MTSFSKQSILQTGISAFEGWIVDIDSVCEPRELPGNVATLVDTHSLSQLDEANKPVQKPVVAQQLCKWKSKFSQPRAVPVIQQAAKTPPPQIQSVDTDRVVPKAMGEPVLSGAKQAGATQPAQLSLSSNRTGECSILTDAARCQLCGKSWWPHWTDLDMQMMKFWVSWTALTPHHLITMRYVLSFA